MVRRVIRVLELPVSLSVGVLRESASLAGRVVGRLLVGGGPSEPPAPPPTPEPAKPRAARTGHAPARERGSARAKPSRPAASRARKRPAAKHDNGAERTEAPTPGPTDVPRPPDLSEAPPAPKATKSEAPAKPAPAEESQTETATSPGPPESPPLASAPQPPATRTSETTATATTEPTAADGPKPVGEVEHEPGVGTSVRAPDPHSALNTPIGEPDPTEWPDPYDRREDPRDVPAGEEMTFGEEAHPPTGATSTSEPHPNQDPEAEPWEGPKRDRVDR